ncbi:MAG: ROK family protein [Microbacteriaceae bacterium]|nr:MAG: ROK family protein [Microbacteriaceae bacterium]
MPAISGPVIALDVGGTTIKGAIVDEQYRFTQTDTWPTPRSEGPQAVVDAVCSAIDTLAQQARSAVAVGLVVPGLVDDRAGTALFSENIGWRDVPFRELAADISGLPVGFGHDVRAAGLAERTLGAARGVDDVLFLPIGTGISGAMVVSGCAIENKYAGEIGHIDVGSGEHCACGAFGCLETIASGPSIARRYTQASGRSAAEAREVVALMAAGDRTAELVWNEAVYALARALVTYISLLAPELIVIGGGVSEAGPVLLEPLRRRLGELLVWQQEPRIVLSAFGARAGLLGAAWSAHSAIDSTSDRIPIEGAREKTRKNNHA